MNPNRNLLLSHLSSWCTLHRLPISIVPAFLLSPGASITGVCLHLGHVVSHPLFSSTVPLYSHKQKKLLSPMPSYVLFPEFKRPFSRRPPWILFHLVESANVISYFSLLSSSNQLSINIRLLTWIMYVPVDLNLLPLPPSWFLKILYYHYPFIIFCLVFRPSSQRHVYSGLNLLVWRNQCQRGWNEADAYFSRW